ncbi:MAG: hypothetical protein KAS71_18510 [Bacteroidales bacterium]|nr:hypothetical protein [Bacteroidales bacterium]
MNIFYNRKWITKESLDKLESQAIEITSMIKGLINSLYKS